jgi:dolichol-phosphate mannosyltransferase
VSAPVLVVTPTYNEKDNLETFLDGVFASVPEAHVLVVDDNSPDGTGELADRLAEGELRLSVMHRPGKAGLGTAYVAGFRWGLERGYPLFFQMDTDLSHDPRYMGGFLREIEAGADLVLGSRNIPGGGVEGWGPGRQLLSKGGSLYSRAILGLPYRDLTGGYKLWRREVLADLELGAVRSSGYSFQIEMTYRAHRKGYRVREIPILFVDRQVGKSKMSREIFAEAVFMVWKLRFDAVRGEF